MLMILYLTSKRYMNILDFLDETEDVIIKKYVGEYNLKDFLGKSIQRLGHIETIVIDRSCILDTNEEIIEVLKTYMAISKMRIVFYFDSLDKEVISNLIGLGIYNIITESEVEKLKEEIEMSLLEGMKERYVKSKIGLLCDNEEKIPFDFKGKQITIGVVGSQHRVGTTTVAMQFATYLRSIGANVSYVEANNSGHLSLIAEHYNMERNGFGYQYKGISFDNINSTNNTVFDFMVYDLGVLSSITIKGLLNSRLRILCSGKQPHELHFWSKAKQLLGDIDYTTVFNGFTCKNEGNVYSTLPWEEVLGENSNKEIFRNITENFLRICVNE